LKGVDFKTILSSITGTRNKNFFTKKIGYITSGNYCPSLKKVYALAILKIPFAKTGNRVKVLIRDKEVEAEIVDIPFLAPFNKR